MNRSETIQTRIDPQTKKKAAKILSALNLSMSEAIGIYLRQIILNNGIPFEIKIPNDLTLRTVEKTERGKEVKRFSSEEELFEDLGI